MSELRGTGEHARLSTCYAFDFLYWSKVSRKRSRSCFDSKYVAEKRCFLGLIPRMLELHDGKTWDTLEVAGITGQYLISE
jgi:hypothetical protein